ncbi:WhiB family transcriptional regulator [Streptomyces sp. NPDC048508]|uniref:WhiB family transcriptional regulator n=1 Tax=Streptomyces sp. NPDC048508 TaxID=3365561 RepID=UPI0037136A4D
MHQQSQPHSIAKSSPRTWQDLARCVTTHVNPDTFFELAPEAKKICARCPVKTNCLDTALEHSEVFGVWGGMTVAERNRLKLERRLKFTNAGAS